MASATFGHSNKGLQLQANHGSVHAEFYQSDNREDIDHCCFQNLDCPNSFDIKNRLTKSKDKLHRQSWEWILQTSQYQSWANDSDVCLLWIKGGPGKGKTMMAIGLIEELSIQENAVAYFFCQYADRALNTLESILKGLILQLAIYNPDLTIPLRRRWDTKNDRFTEDCTSWRNLWNIMLEMVTTQCRYSKVYLVVDALDECQDNGMSEFLRLIVRNGLNQPSKLKWLLTSRPLESAERALLTGHEQMQVSLELNSLQISQAVEAYISHKLNELEVAQRYVGSLKEEIRAELSAKSETTFLWVSLVCKQLEDIPKDNALSMIQSIPPGLYALYDQAVTRLRDNERDDLHRYMGLLKAMMLAYRPLNIAEIGMVTGLTETEDSVRALANQCTTLLRIQAGHIEFVHQSTRDYLAEETTQSMIEAYTMFGHKEMLQNCLFGLTQHLKINILNLPRPNSTRDSPDLLKKGKLNLTLDHLKFPATFWVNHLTDADLDTTDLAKTLQHVNEFLHTMFLEWLECLSLLNKLPLAVKLLQTLNDLPQNHTKLSAFVKDGTRFLMRHYHTIKRWPLQLYSSAIVFSPESSVARQVNISKTPKYLRHHLFVEDKWSPRIQTLEGHTDKVVALAFSPDGKYIVSGARDSTLRLWDYWTGALQMTIQANSSVRDVAFSPDGKRVASASGYTVDIWDISISTGVPKLTLNGHSGFVNFVQFPQDGDHIVSKSDDKTMKLWNSSTGVLERTLKGFKNLDCEVTFSPDGTRIASSAEEDTVKVWDLAGDLKMTINAHSDSVTAVQFSPNCRQIASCSWRGMIKLWDSSTGILQTTMDGLVETHKVMFSPDGNRLLSVSYTGRVTIWSLTGNCLMILRDTGLSHAIVISNDCERLASDYGTNIQIFEITDGEELAFKGGSVCRSRIEFSSDGTHIATSSWGQDLILWKTARFSQKILKQQEGSIQPLAISPDNHYIASASGCTVTIWDTLNGGSQRRLQGHDRGIEILAFSPDSKYVSSGATDGTIILWDSATWDFKKMKGRSDGIQSLVFSLDGKFIASASDTIILWETATGKRRKKLKRALGPFMIETLGILSFSPDGRYLISKGGRPTIDLWNIAECLEAHSFFGGFLRRYLKFRHYKLLEIPDEVWDFEFSEDGQFLKTNIGPITLEGLSDGNMNGNSGYPPYLFIRDQWIWYGESAFLRIPGDYRLHHWKAKGDLVVLSLPSGRLMILDIDQDVVRSMLEQLPGFELGEASFSRA